MNSTDLQKSESRAERVPKPQPFNLNFPLKKPKVINLESFEQLSNLGKGKYGQVYLVRYILSNSDKRPRTSSAL